MRRAIALTALLLLASAPRAKAAYDPIGSGATKLTLERSFVSLLKKHGVTLSAKPPAKLKGNVLALPVSGGEMDPLAAKGTIEHEGVLIFASKRRSVPLRAITLKAKKTPLIAKVGGSQLKVAKAKQVSATRLGFGERLLAKQLTLTQKVATRLNKKLGLGRLLKEGQPFGRSSSDTQPQTIEILPKGRATFTPDPAFKAKLESRFVSVNPISPAEGGGGAFTFPIGPEGAIAPDASLGTLKLTGRLEFLQLGAGQVFWGAPWLELSPQITSAELEIQPTPAFPGALGRVGALGLNLGAAAISADPKARTISVSGAPLALSAQSAEAFNRAFAAGGPSVFGTGEAVGVVGFVAWGR